MILIVVRVDAVEINPCAIGQKDKTTQMILSILHWSGLDIGIVQVCEAVILITGELSRPCAVIIVEIELRPPFSEHLPCHFQISFHDIA